MGKLSVGGCARHVGQGQACQKHNECKNNHQSGAFGCAITRMEKVFHGVVVASLCRGANLVAASLCRGVARRHSTVATTPRGELNRGFMELKASAGKDTDSVRTPGCRKW